MIDRDRTSDIQDGYVRYDELTAADQARVRAHWREEIRETIGRLDLRAEFEAAGETWSEADADGRLAIRGHSQIPAAEDGSAQ